MFEVLFLFRVVFGIVFADFFSANVFPHIHFSRNWSHCLHGHRVQPYELSLPLTNITHRIYASLNCECAAVDGGGTHTVMGANFFSSSETISLSSLGKLRERTWRRRRRKKRIVLNILFHLCMRSFTNSQICPCLALSSSQSSPSNHLFSSSTAFTERALFYVIIICVVLSTMAKILLPHNDDAPTRRRYTYIYINCMYWINKKSEIWMETFAIFFSLSKEVFRQEAIIFKLCRTYVLSQRHDYANLRCQRRWTAQ